MFWKNRNNYYSKDIKDLTDKIDILNDRITLLETKEALRRNPPDIIIVKENDYEFPWSAINPSMNFYTKDLVKLPDSIFRYYEKHIVNSDGKDYNEIPARITGLGFAYKQDSEGFFRLVKDGE